MQTCLIQMAFCGRCIDEELEIELPLVEIGNGPYILFDMTGESKWNKHAARALTKSWQATAMTLCNGSDQILDFTEMPGNDCYLNCANPATL